MTTKRILYLILIIVILLSCKKKQHKLDFKQSELDFEQTVAYQIFPLLMDSLHRDYRLFPPPGQVVIYDKKGKYIGIDSIATEDVIKKFQKKQAKFKADSVKLVTAINDSTYLLGKIDKKSLLKHFSDFGLKLDTINISSNYKIDIKRLKADDKIIFKYLSEFPKGRAKWITKYDFHLNETTGFSRIQFDSTKSFGVLKSGMGFGILCGTGVRIFIKKENDKWIIDEIVVVEIS